MYNQHRDCYYKYQCAECKFKDRFKLDDVEDKDIGCPKFKRCWTYAPDKGYKNNWIKNVEVK